MKFLRHLKLTPFIRNMMLALCIVLLTTQPLLAQKKDAYRVGIYTDKAPYTFVSWSKTGMKLRGAYIDLMTQIAYHMGVEFQYVKVRDPDMMIRFFKQKKIDVMGLTLGNPFPFHLKGVKTIPVGLSMTSWLFVNQDCKTIVCQKDLPGKRVSLIGFGDLNKWPYDSSDVSDIIIVHSPLEGLTLINQGKAHAFIAPSEEIASYIIQKQGFENIRRVGLALRKIPLALSVDETDTRLVKRLSHAIQQTKRSGIIGQIEDKWYGIEFRQSFFEKYSRLIFSVIVFVILVLGFVITWNHQLKKQVEKITSRYRTSEKRYRNLIESSADMMFVVNRDAIPESQPGSSRLKQ